MPTNSFKRTKIVTTIGPASDSREVMEKLIAAGANVFRMNFSHGSHDEHGARIKLARELSEAAATPIALLADLQGPKIRVGILPDDGFEFKLGATVKFAMDTDFAASGIVPLQYDVTPYVKAGERIFLRDGMIAVDVTGVADGVITTTVTTPGVLKTKQGMNLPDTDLGGEIMTPKDIADLEFAIGAGVDYVALSFVQTPTDIINLKERIKNLGATTPVIVKFETRMAVKYLEEIVQTADGIMVARGDLAVETEAESVPTVQRRLIELGQRYKKPVIVATQMMESMITSPTPTRAEVSDVATAVYQGADAVMLSAESAAGQFPVETVAIMDRVITYTEAHMGRPIPYRFGDGHELENAVAAAAIILAAQVGAKMIVAETSTGATARNVSGFRPPLPIVMVTDQKSTYFQMALLWGGKSYFEDKAEGAGDAVIARLKVSGELSVGDIVVVAWGTHPGVAGGTDSLQVRTVV